MKTFSEALYHEMNGTLRKISTEADHTLQQAEQSYHTVQEAMQKLKDFILSYHFKDRKEEIHFFKRIKPKFLKELIFFEELFYIESGRPVGSTKEQKEHLDQHLEHISHFFKRNRQLYTYHRMDKSYNDEVYFVRESHDLPLAPDKYCLDIDSRFSTSYSFKFSRLQAYENLRNYLQNAIVGMDQKTPLPGASPKSKLKWTAPKVSLVELVYAFKAAGVFNNGTANINEIAALLETTFQRDLSEFYRTFQEIRIRKKSRTSFIDLLQSRLQQWMDDADRME